MIRPFGHPGQSRAYQVPNGQFQSIRYQRAGGWNVYMSAERPNTTAVYRDRYPTQFGDAASDARAKAVSDAGAYKFPNPPKSRAQALVAFYAFMRMAASEDSPNANYYRSQGNGAALKFASAPVWNILQTAVDLTKRSAKRTSAQASTMLAATRSVTPAKSSTRSSRPAAELEHDHASELVTAAPTMADWLADPPFWAKQAGVGVLGLLGVWALWPRRRAAVAGA